MKTPSLQLEKGSPEPCLTVAEVCALTRLSKATIYEQINTGRMAHIKVGRSVRIPNSCYKSWLDSHRSARKTA